MTKRAFDPGFRLSALDVLILMIGGTGAVAVALVDRWFGIAIGFVVLHFFLFCNILRMSRSLELAWAGFFVGFAIAAGRLALLSWPAVFAGSVALTLVLTYIEVRRPSYHGVGWQALNPGLPDWWKARSPDED